MGLEKGEWSSLLRTMLCHSWHGVHRVAEKRSDKGRNRSMLSEVVVGRWAHLNNLVILIKVEFGQKYYRRVKRGCGKSSQYRLIQLKLFLTIQILSEISFARLCCRIWSTCFFTSRSWGLEIWNFMTRLYWRKPLKVPDQKRISSVCTISNDHTDEPGLHLLWMGISSKECNVIIWLLSLLSWHISF